jgi:hypothetical protein
MAANNNNIFEQVWNVREDESVTSGVAMVICVLLQRGMLAAGFGLNKELLTMHYTGYNKNKPVWEINFFEHLFGQEPLLAVREKVKGVFICNNKQLVIPDALYEANAAKDWLKHLYFIERKDVIDTYNLDDDKARYVMGLPVYISELIKINFKKATVLPMPIYQFRNANKQSLYLQCCVTGEEVCATLHNYSQLLWHKVFDYTTAEDIAFEIRQLCQENNISPSKISLRCNAVSAAEYDVVCDLSQYFPGIRGGNGRNIATRWDPAIFLAQQLFTCVS